MADYKDLILDFEGSLATITLNRPERLNALSKNLNAELLAAIREVGAASSPARALLIKGNERAFSAGADLAVDQIDPRDIDLGRSLIDIYHPILLELANLPMPVVSAVSGVAAGAGMSIAISADIVLASRSAYFLQAFVNIGLVPDAGSTFILPRLVGNARARAMMMLGERVPAETALEWGLVYDVVDDDSLESSAKDLAQKLADGPTCALSGIRQLMASSMKNNYAEQLQAEATVQRVAGKSKDAMEGIMAFLQKRKANFLGK